MTKQSYPHFLKSDLGKSILLNLIFFICALLFCEQKYEVSDDFVMETVLSGAYGTQENPHMLFVNIILGYILLPFYRLFPGISWYFITLLLAGFIAFVVIVYLIFKQSSSTTAFLLSVILLVFFSNDIYILVQFTKTAALCLFGGALLILYTLFYTKDKIQLIVGILLGLLGSWIRFQTLYEVLPFILILFVFESCLYFHQSRFKEKKTVIFNYVKLFLSVILIMASIICCQFIDKISYQSNEEYRQYRDYAQARSSIVDSRDLGYEAYRLELEKLGVSENDYRMLRRWNFSDPDYFSIEKMQAIAHIIQSKNSTYWGGWQILFEQMQTRGYGTYAICLACILLFLLALVYAPRYWWGYVGSVFLGFCLLLLFYIIGRVVYRVEYGIFVGIFLTILYFFDTDLYLKKAKTDDDMNKTTVLILTAICLLYQLPTYIPNSEYKDISTEQRKSYLDSVYDKSWNYDMRKYRKITGIFESNTGLIAEMESHPDSFYFLEFESTIQSLYYDWDAFDSLGVGYYQNYMYLSGVTTHFPDTTALLAVNDLDNPYQSLVKEHVYLVANSMHEHILTYLQEHYYPNARVEWIKNVEGYNIWKFYEE